MKSDELAAFAKELAERCAKRVLGSGHDQYTLKDGSQLFEILPMDRLLEMMQEEAEDLNNYTAMVWIRLEQFRQALQGLDLTALAGKDVVGFSVDRLKEGGFQAILSIKQSEDGTLKHWYTGRENTPLLALQEACKEYQQEKRQQNGF